MKRNAGILFAAACAAFLLSTGCSTAEPAPETPLAPDGSEKKYVQVQDDPLFADVFGTTTISRPHNPALLISESDYRKAKTQKTSAGSIRI